MLNFFKKNWLILILLIFTVVLIYPPTGMPIKVFVQRLMMFSPTVLSEDERHSLAEYNWELHDLEGQRVSFSDSKGNVVLINFWATWCPPCVAELPSMQDLFSEYGDRAHFYFVTSEDPKVVQRFMEKKGYDFPIYFEVHKPPSLLRVNSIPTTFVLAKDGEVMIKKTGAAKWDDEKIKLLVDELLAEELP